MRVLSRLLLVLFLPFVIFSNDLEDKKHKEENERLKFQNQDALIELKIKELQLEIEKEKVDILLSEKNYQKQYSENFINLKKKRTLKNIILPGLGSIYTEDYFLGSIFLLSFGFSVSSAYVNYVNAKNTQREINQTSSYEFLEQSRLESQYQNYVLRSNLFMISSMFIYLINLLESNRWSQNILFSNKANYRIDSSMTFTNIESKYIVSINIQF